MMTSMNNCFKILLLTIVLWTVVFVYLKLGKTVLSRNKLLLPVEVERKQPSQVVTVEQYHDGEYKTSIDDLNVLVTTEKRINLKKATPNIMSASMPRTPPPNLPWDLELLKITPITLMKQSWVRELWIFLHTKIDTQFPIAITTSSVSFQSSLLNWLANALVKTDEKDRLKNILILSLDEKLHSFFRTRNFSSLYLPPFAGSKKEGLICVEIARLLTMRMINFWGYDVINYDSDAFILKNPQSLFDQYQESHVIGSEAYMPRDLHDKWGVTLCMGVVHIKASPETECLWEAMSKRNIRDDQKKLNFGLDSLKLHFTKRNNNSTEAWQGETPILNDSAQTKLRVTVVPMDKICRGPACILSNVPSVYVWHQGSNHNFENMKKKSVHAKVWIIRNDWLSLDAGYTLTGLDWLRTIITDDKSSLWRHVN